MCLTRLGLDHPVDNDTANASHAVNEEVPVITITAISDDESSDDGDSLNDGPSPDEMHLDTEVVLFDNTFPDAPTSDHLMSRASSNHLLSRENMELPGTINQCREKSLSNH